MARSTYEDFVIKERIGSGSYGVVYKVIRKVDRNTYAMKEIDLQGMTRKEQEECIRETRVLSALHSDSIIKYYDAFLERGKLYIITEYASKGNLHDFIKQSKAKLPEDLIYKLFIQLLLGLNHMHAKKILHRDVKTLNIFLDDDVNVKLGDLGVAKILTTQNNFAKTIVGTPYYLSPELCEDKPYNEKSDVWALGVVLYECCTQRHPFDADNQGALILKILRGKYPPISGYSAEIADVVKRCLTQAAAKRPNTDRLLMLPCIRDKAAQLGIQLPAHILQAAAAAAGPAAAPAERRLSSNAERAAAAAAAAESSGRQPAAGGAAAVANRRVSGNAAPPGASTSSTGLLRQPSVGAGGAPRPASASAQRRLRTAESQAAAQAVRDLPPSVGHGVIRVVGDMDKPPVLIRATDEELQQVTSTSTVVSSSGTGGAPVPPVIIGGGGGGGSNDSAVAADDFDATVAAWAPYRAASGSSGLDATMAAAAAAAPGSDAVHVEHPAEGATPLEVFWKVSSSDLGRRGSDRAGGSGDEGPASQPWQSQQPGRRADSGGAGGDDERPASAAAADVSIVGGYDEDLDATMAAPSGGAAQRAAGGGGGGVAAGAGRQSADFDEPEDEYEAALPDEEEEEEDEGPKGDEDGDDEAPADSGRGSSALEATLPAAAGAALHSGRRSRGAAEQARLRHMQQAVALQRAAIVDLVGAPAYEELHSLLVHQSSSGAADDPADMTELSRRCFRIIPYDKSEVIPMMYKMLYLESQLED